MKRRTPNIPFVLTERRIHFSLWVVVYCSLRGVSWPSGLRPAMIKPRFTVSAAHLKIITGSRGVNQRAGCRSFIAEAISTEPLMLFHYHLRHGVNRKHHLPSDSDWLRVETVGMDSDTEVLSPLSNCPVISGHLLKRRNQQQIYPTNECLCQPDVAYMSVPKTYSILYLLLNYFEHTVTCALYFQTYAIWGTLREKKENSHWL